jgi:hypothetical protein
LTGASFTRRSAVVLVGIGVLLVAGAVGWGAIGTESTGAESTDVETETAGAESAELQDEGDGNETDGNASVISSNQTIDSLRAVENRTNGTVFRARLSGEPSSDLDESEFVYELDVLAENGTHLVVEVYAANTTVIAVTPANDSEGFFADLFGSSDDVPDEVREADDLRSATDAVRLAMNETDAAAENRTITQVVLATQNETLVYSIQQFDPSGEPQEIIVAATGDGDDAVTTDPKRSRTLLARG